MSIASKRLTKVIRQVNNIDKRLQLVEEYLNHQVDDDFERELLTRLKRHGVLDLIQKGVSPEGDTPKD